MEPGKNFSMFATTFLRQTPDMPPLIMTDGSYLLNTGAMGRHDTPLKICAVCGDRALSCNFGAITCESCKAFFRRNATRAQEIYSRCDERCVINVQSRSHCKHCRLLKCFTVGMRADLILTEEQKRERRQKIAENRQRRMQSSNNVSTADCVSSTENDSNSPKLDSAQESVYNKVVRWEMSRANNHSSEGNSSPESESRQISPGIQYSSEFVGTKVFRSSSVRESSDSSMDVTEDDVHHGKDQSFQTITPSVNHYSSAEEYEHRHKRQRSDTDLQIKSSVHGQHTVEANSTSSSISQDHAISQGHAITQDADLKSVTLMSSERAELIYNLALAFRQSFDQPVAQTQALKAEGSTVDFLNMADLTIRRLVKMARCLHCFRLLDQQYQIDLLKGCVVDVLLLRSIKNFDLSRQGWMTQTKENKQFVSANNFKMDPAVGAEYFKKYALAAVALQEATQRDAVVLMLLIVLSLLNPKYLSSDDPVVHVERSRLSYIEAMKEYLLIKYEDVKESLYNNIIQKLNEFILLGSFHNELLKHTSAGDLEPLVVEMFDLL